MDELKFKVSSALKNLVGKDLITNDNVAIFELVKNAYDAYASNVILTFSEDKIIIADNGIGMSLKEIEDKWLFLGFSDKKYSSFHKEKQHSYRDKIKRYYAGAKGIGRLSCDRLGRWMTMITRPETQNYAEWLEIDWNNFEKDQYVKFEEVPVLHKIVYEAFTFPLNSNHGTIIEITGLRKDEIQWNRKHLLDLKRSLEKLINPLAEENDFSIEIICEREKLEDKKKIEEGKGFDRDIVNGIIKNSISNFLKLKTTQIDVKIKNNQIITTLSDRGIEIYKIRESNLEFNLLDNATITLSFLNRAAKYNFTRLMGVEVVNYGSIFLFRNGFRVLPFGETGDDSWGLDFRAQQGYNRYLGSRDLLGRVDVFTDKLEDLKEVSSRDGGLVESPMSRQIKSLFEVAHRRLERYVVGVLWGEGFLKHDYFNSKENDLEERKKLQTQDKDSDNPNYVLKDSLGSKLDFIKLIKALASDDKIEILYYNPDLTNILESTRDNYTLNPQSLADLEAIVKKTDNQLLVDDIRYTLQKIDNLNKAKEDAEKKAKKAEIKAKKADKDRKKAEAKAKEEKEKREKVEKEKKIESLKAEFYKKASNPDTDALIHHVRNNSRNIEELLNQLINYIKLNITDKNIIKHVIISLSQIQQLSNKSLKAADLILKSDLSEADSQKINLPSFIEGYIQNEVQANINCHFYSDVDKFYIVGSKLDLSLIIDNFITNSYDWGAKNIWFRCKLDNNKLILDILDDGSGLSTKFQDSPEEIFDFAATAKADGAGFGMYLIKETLKSLHASISIDNTSKGKGMHFKITFI